MTTPLPIDDEVMRRLQEEAARRGSTPVELEEEALRRLLESRREGSSVVELPIFRGGDALVDLRDREALFRAMEEPWLSVSTRGGSATSGVLSPANLRRHRAGKSQP